MASAAALAAVSVASTLPMCSPASSATTYARQAATQVQTVLKRNIHATYGLEIERVLANVKNESKMEPYGLLVMLHGRLLLIGATQFLGTLHACVPLDLPRQDRVGEFLIGKCFVAHRQHVFFPLCKIGRQFDTECF